MSGSGRKPGDANRPISEAEADLWKHATRTLSPIKVKPRVTEAKEPAPAPPRQPAPLPKKDLPTAAAPAPARKIEPPRRLAPLADLDRRKVRQIASGKVEIEARIDLHGLRQHEAAARLRAFLLDAYARGLKTVLVITGKGGDVDRDDHAREMMGAGRRGVLRRNVPDWLAAPELRSVVLGYTQAGIRHGGDGAIYVQLRKSPGSS
jgi:DNA-nicking Smr family endonuclease